MNEQFWTDKRVFITGHSGFKGGWLAIWLSNLGAIVKGYSLNPPTAPSLFGSAEIEKLIESEMGDIRDTKALEASMKLFQPEIVFHLAAQPLVRLSYEVPVETFSTNVMGTVNVLEAIRDNACIKAVVVVTSDKCYENKEWHWGYRESEPLGGYDAYSASKACAELVTHSYRQSFFEDGGAPLCVVASARAGNVIGGGDWAADRLMPDILRNLQRGTPIVIRNPNAIRPWQHVLEPLSGYMILAKLLYESGREYAQAWNFGPPETGAKSVQWMVEEVIGQWGSGRWEFEGGDHPHEATYLKLDCSMARHELGWMPVWNPVEALAATVNWHKAWVDDANVHDLCLDDIARYTQEFQRLSDNDHSRDASH